MSNLFGIWGKDRARRLALAALPVAPFPTMPYHCPWVLEALWVARNEPSAAAVRNAIALGYPGCATMATTYNPKEDETP